MEELDMKKIKTAGAILVFSIFLMIVTKVMTYEGGPKKKLEKLTENLFPVSEAAGSDEFEEEEDE